LAVFTNEQACIPEAGDVRCAVRPLRRLDDTRKYRTLADKMDLQIGRSAAAVCVRRNGGEKLASIRLLSSAPNDNECVCEQRPKVSHLAGLFCLQDALIQVRNLTLDAQAHMLLL
jgi:hypothetical protein